MQREGRFRAVTTIKTHWFWSVKGAKLSGVAFWLRKAKKELSGTLLQSEVDSQLSAGFFMFKAETDSVQTGRFSRNLTAGQHLEKIRFFFPLSINRKHLGFHLKIIIVSSHLLQWLGNIFIVHHCEVKSEDPKPSHNTSSCMFRLVVLLEGIMGNFFQD